jgi:hypothetical protein
MTRLRWTCAMIGTFLLAGCATVITGTRQDIQVESQPAGAVCTFTRDGETLGSVTTPGSLKVKRDAAPMTVVCARADYEEARAVMHARTEMATLGSAIIGGFIATHIDRGSGAANRYETSLRVELTPMSAADKAAAATARVAALAAAPASAAAPAPAAPPPVLTGLWKARNVLIADRSAAGCSRDGGAYSLDVSGDTFTVDNINGRMLVTTLPADGAIDQPFRSPSGSRLAIVGNARTRDLEIVNSAAGCRWKLTPLS